MITVATQPSVKVIGAISGDMDLLVLNGQLPFVIEAPAIFRERI